MPDAAVSEVDLPNYERLRGEGWSVGAIVGRYCVAWRGPEEVVLVWQHGEWRQVTGRGAIRQAA